MRLFYFPVAPNPTRLRIYLAEKGIEIEQVLIDLPKGEQKSPEHLKRNPAGNLPVLELDDGSTLTESLAIIEFFEELHPDPPMIGRSPIERARNRQLERLAEIGVLAHIARIVHATRSPLGLPPVPEVARDAAQRLPVALRILNDRIGEQPFLGGDNPVVADCTLFAALHFGRFFDVEIDPEFERIHSWFGRFSARPSTQS